MKFEVYDFAKTDLKRVGLESNSVVSKAEIARNLKVVYRD